MPKHVRTPKLYISMYYKTNALKKERNTQT